MNGKSILLCGTRLRNERHCEARVVFGHESEPCRYRYLKAAPVEYGFLKIVINLTIYLLMSHECPV